MNKRWLTNGVFTDIPPSVHDASGKTTPVDNDEFALLDSEKGYGRRKFTWANLITGVRATLASAAFRVGSLELGHNSDTTVGRTSEGVANVEGFNIVTLDFVTKSDATALPGVAARLYIVHLESGSSGTPLPTAVGNTSVYLLKNNNTADTTVATTLSQTIEAQTTLVLHAGASVTLVSDQANWRVL